ncbi:NYN domain protein [compost metagenome]
MIVLLSGDGDFDLLLKRVSRNSEINTLVYGVNKLTAASLIEAADKFKAIDESLLLR